MHSFTHFITSSLPSPTSFFPILLSSQSLVPMAFHLLATAAFLFMSLMTIHAALPAEEYWNSKLPATPMPRAITLALHAGHGAPHNMVLVGNTCYSNCNYNDKKGPKDEQVALAGNDGYGNSGYNNEEHSVVAEPLTSLKSAGNDGYGNHGYNNQEDKPLVDLKVAGNDKYGNSDYSIDGGLKTPLVNPPTALYFLEKDLFPGKEFTLEINRRENGASAFLPRHVAKSLPFSADKLSEILDKFSVKPGSKDAEKMKRTIDMCSTPASKDETKQCVTSLESMIDFSIAELGKNIKAVSTVSEKDTKLQKFKVLNGIKMLARDEAVVCHKETYTYAVFLCHDLKSTRSYLVPLIGADGTKAKATAVCHFDTSSWNPEHMALRILNVKAGTVPVCHFLPEYDVVWTRK